MKAKLVVFFFFALELKQKYSESFAILQFPLGFKRFKQLILPSADNFTKKDEKPVQVVLMQWPTTLDSKLYIRTNLSVVS